MHENHFFSCIKDGKSTVSSPRNDFYFRGTSLGGWLVLEPWLTPSLFYQFLGLSVKYGTETKDHIAIDSKTFCSALGPQEANRQLRQHWKTWVNEKQIQSLARKNVERKKNRSCQGSMVKQREPTPSGRFAPWPP